MLTIDGVSQIMVLMFTDVVGSVDLKTQLGTSRYVQLISGHDNLFKQIVGQIAGGQILKDTGDGFLTRFNTISDAVIAALRFQYALSKSAAEPRPLKVRIGVHLGEVTSLEKDIEGVPKIVGLAADMAARVMGLAEPGQILMTRVAFDDGRQYIREHPSVDPWSEGQPPPALKWMAHGRYLFKGADEPTDVFEVGAVGVAPFKAPRDGEKARRVVAFDEEETLGWRPGVNLAIPQRPGWVIERKLGEGGFGEVWLGVNDKTRQRRVFKFCFDVERLRSFKRELALFRVLYETLGERDDIVKLHDVHLDHSPFFIESEFTAKGNLIDWARTRGGIDKLPLDVRVEMVQRVTQAVAAAHSAGILHKDIKPSNILVHELDDGSPRPRLADFGIGILTDRSRLQGLNITATGLTEGWMTNNDSSRTGTRIYAPPETLVGKPFTVQGDVYALGVLLYQMVVGDLDRPLATSWHRDVADEHLREDIELCVDGDLSRRLATAQELATRLSSLPQRRAALRQQEQAQSRRSNFMKWRQRAVLGVLLLLVVGFVAQRWLFPPEICPDPAMGGHYGATHPQQAAAPAPGGPGGPAAPADPGAVTQPGVSPIVAASATPVAATEHDPAPDAVPDAAPTSTQNAGALADESPRNLPPAPGALLDRFRRGSDPRVRPGALGRGGRPGARFENMVGEVRKRQLANQSGARLPMSSTALVSAPTTVPGVLSWSMETKGHRGDVLALAAHGEAKMLASGGQDGAIRIWQGPEGKLVRVLLGHEGPIRSLVWLGSGEMLASASDDGTVRLWDLKQGVMLISLPDYAAGVSALACSASRRTLAYASSAGSVLLYDAQNRRRAAIDPGQSPATAVAFSADGEQLAIGCGDGSLHLCAGDTGAVLQSFSGPDAPITAVLFGSDDKTLFSADAAGDLIIWNQNQIRQVMKVNGPVQSLALAPDGKTLAAVGERVTLWDVASGKSTGLDLVSTSRLGSAILFMPEGHSVVVGGDSAAIEQFNVHSGKLEATIPGYPWSPNQALAAWSPKHNGLALAMNGSLQIWNPINGRLLQTLSPPVHPLADLAFAPGGTALAGCDVTGKLYLWSAAGNDPTAVTLPHRTGSIAFSPDGATLALGQLQAGQVQLCNSANGLVQRTISAPQQWSGQVFFAPDGGSLILPGAALVVQPLEPQAAPRRLEGAAPSDFAAFSPDGALLATCGEQTLQLWSWPAGTLLRSFKDFHNSGARVCFSADGKLLLTAAQAPGDLTASAWRAGVEALQSWDRDSGVIRASHPGPLGGRFSSDGTLLAEPGPAGVRIWNVADGTVLATLLNLGDQQAQLRGDGFWRASGSADDRVVYVIETEEGQQTLSAEEFTSRFKVNPGRLSPVLAGDSGDGPR